MDDAVLIKEERIAKLKRTRSQHKGQCKKITSRMNGESAKTEEIDPVAIDAMLVSTKAALRNLAEIHEALVVADPGHEADYDEDLTKSVDCLEKLQVQLTHRSNVGHACVQMERLGEKIHHFIIHEDCDAQLLHDQVKKHSSDYDEALDKYRGVIRKDVHLSGMKQGIAEELAKLVSQLPACAAPTGPRRRHGDADPPEPVDRPPYHRRLPAIETPKFSGNFLEWESFWTTFKRNVHDNADLNDDERRSYLQQSIKDSAQHNLVDALAGSYSECIASLKARYHQPRRVHQHSVRAFLACKPCKDDSRLELTRVHSTLSQAWRRVTCTKKTSGDQIFESFAESLLSPSLWRRWTELHPDQFTIPLLAELLSFLEFQANLAQHQPVEQQSPRRERERPADRPRQDRPRHDRRPSTSRDDRPTREVMAATVTHPCLLCKETGHSLYGCSQFREQTVDQRTEFVTKAKLCYNCLCPSHDKRSCKSTYKCKTCNRRHHSMLHKDRAASSHESSDASATRSNANVVNHVSSCDSGIKETLSPTLSLMAQAPSGRETNITALYDTGASLSLITNRVVTKLGLKKRRCNVSIVQALGGEQTNTNMVDLTLTSQHLPGEVRELTAVVVPRLGGTGSPLPITKNWEFLSTLPLADPDFCQRRKFDIILGQDILNQIVLKGQRQGTDNSITAQETVWGWTVQGQVGRSQRLPTKETTATSHCTSIVASVALDKLHAEREGNDLLRTFFGSESLEEEPTQTIEDQEALDHFARTHKVLPGGRMQVTLPRRQDRLELGNSRGAALRRYIQNERSLTRRKALQPFQRVMEEYFTLDHAEMIPPDEVQTPVSSHYYMPLHAVVKATSTTTKLRIVFDASASSSSGVSLNDTLLTGPTVHPPLTEILARFRTHRIGMTSDISKMYREIVLDPDDRDLHRFLWRQTPTDVIKDCRMKRVTFGVASSPFMATQALQQVAQDVEQEYPRAALAIRTEFYVDDYISGAETALQALSTQQEVQQVLGRHHLTLRKWRSSSAKVLEGIPEDLRETETSIEPYGQRHYMKTLGIQWDATKDEFYVSTSDLALPTTITKRALTSDIARTFDVMGWFAPATLSMKALIQRLWAAGMDWDDQVPPEVQTEWTLWRRELPLLANQPIPRSYFRYDQGPRQQVSLHGFSDASLRGYAAVVYVRATYLNGPPSIKLIQAKTKVAPLKGMTVPRLELCGAQLLSSLITTVRTALKIPLQDVQCWTDSQIVRYWLDGRTRPHRVFVANRIRRTLERVPPQHWFHVPGKDNPADCASRGITPGALQALGLWWHGPVWLSTDPIQTPPQPYLAHLDQSEEEIVKKKVVAVIMKEEIIIEERYSTYACLRRTVAWMLRFARNCKIQAVDRHDHQILTVKDLEAAERVLYRRAQTRMIHGDRMDAWQKDKRTRSLNPTKDNHGIFRVNGRLGNSPLEYAQRCPIILEGRDILTKRIINHHHYATGHSGPTLLMSTIGRNHYVIQGMATVKAICRNCVTCQRFRTQTETQLMGQLPAARVTPGRPFSKVGTDFAGPLTLKKGHTRRPTQIKAYVCAFVCMVTKAVHLEVVSDLTTSAFISCLTRFVGRRGLPTDIFSDNGSNYVGAARELESMYALMRTEETKQAVSGYCTECHIQWHFSPARAPHFGGLWEASIKSFKLHFRRMANKVMFNFEEMSTILCRIEASLNSRPLMPLHAHSTEGVDVLTPGHFLIGQPLNALPEEHIDPTRHPRSRYILCQQLMQRFWERWSQDYLRQLHSRTKWQKERKDVEVGDIALIRGETTYRVNDWPMARVTNLYKGSDGLVRAVDLQSGTRTYRRPIAKLTILVRHQPDTREGTGSRTVDVPLPPTGMSESREDSEEA